MCFYSRGCAVSGASGCSSGCRKCMFGIMETHSIPREGFCDDEERPHYGNMNSRFETIDLSKTSLNEIPDYAFSSCTFVSQNNKKRRVLLPKGLKKIGEHAFEWIGTMELGSLYYSTVEVIIPDELTEICESAFENAGIKRLFTDSCGMYLFVYEVSLRDRSYNRLRHRAFHGEAVPGDEKLNAKIPQLFVMNQKRRFLTFS